MKISLRIAAATSVVLCFALSAYAGQTTTADLEKAGFTRGEILAAPFNCPPTGRPGNAMYPNEIHDCLSSKRSSKSQAPDAANSGGLPSAAGSVIGLVNGTVSERAATAVGLLGGTASEQAAASAFMSMGSGLLGLFGGGGPDAKEMALQREQELVGEIAAAKGAASRSARYAAAQSEAKRAALYQRLAGVVDGAGTSGLSYKAKAAVATARVEAARAKAAAMRLRARDATSQAAGYLTELRAKAAEAAAKAAEVRNALADAASGRHAALAVAVMSGAFAAATVASAPGVAMGALGFGAAAVAYMLKSELDAGLDQFQDGLDRFFEGDR